MNPNDIQLALALFQVAQTTLAALKDLKTNNPEVYEQIAQRHGDALAQAQAAQLAAP